MYLVLWITSVAIADVEVLIGTVTVKVLSRRSYLRSRALRRRESKYTSNKMARLLTRLVFLAITLLLR
jgi:hypothetical protein